MIKNNSSTVIKVKQHLILASFILILLLVFLTSVLWTSFNKNENRLAVPIITDALSMSYDSIRLSWTKCTDSDGYIIYRYDDESQDFEAITTIDDSKVTEHDDFGLTHDTGYAYKIKAYRDRFFSDQESEFSDLVSATTELDSSEIISVKSTGNKNIVVYWAMVDNIDGYELYRSRDAYTDYKKIYEIDDPDSIHYTDRQLKKNKTYHYKIRTYTYVGGEKIISDLSGFESERSIGENAQKLEEDLKETIDDTSVSKEQIISGINIDGYKVIDSFIVKSYAYSGGGLTATGQKCQVGRIAVDPTVIPLGTWLYVEGYGLCQASDTGGDIIGKTIDVYMNTELECRTWGIKYPTVYILSKINY